MEGKYLRVMFPRAMSCIPRPIRIIDLRAGLDAVRSADHLQKNQTKGRYQSG